MDELRMPHKLTLNERSHLILTGVTEVVSFDDTAVLMKTELGSLAVQGSGLQLKSLSADGGQVAVDGNINSMVYEQLRSDGSFWHRLFR